MVHCVHYWCRGSRWRLMRKMSGLWVCMMFDCSRGRCLKYLVLWSTCSTRILLYTHRCCSFAIAITRPRWPCRPTRACDSLWLSQFPRARQRRSQDFTLGATEAERRRRENRGAEGGWDWGGGVSNWLYLESMAANAFLAYLRHTVTQNTSGRENSVTLRPNKASFSLKKPLNRRLGAGMAPWFPCGYASSVRINNVEQFPTGPVKRRHWRTARKRNLKN